MKKLVSALLAATVAVTASAAVYADDDIRVLLDGQELLFDVPPQIIEDFTYVPMRVIFEMLGAQVSWQQETQTVTARRSGDDITEISMTIGSDAMQIKHYSSIDDEALSESVTELEVPPRIIGDRTLVPVRAVAESFGCYVGWNGDSRIVTISTSGASETVENISNVELPASGGETAESVNGAASSDNGKIFVQSVSEMLANAVDPNANPSEETEGEASEQAGEGSDGTEKTADDIVTVEKPESDDEANDEIDFEATDEAIAAADVAETPSFDVSAGLPYDQNPYAVVPVDQEDRSSSSSYLPDLTLPENKDLVSGDGESAGSGDEIMIVYDISGEADVRGASAFRLTSVERGSDGKYDITYTLQTYDDNTTNVTVTFDCLDGEGNVVDSFAAMFRTSAYSWTDQSGKASISDKTESIIMTKR